MRRAAEQFVCLEEWVNRLLEIVKPNEGKFVLNIDVLFSFYFKLKFIDKRLKRFTKRLWLNFTLN